MILNLIKKHPITLFFYAIYLYLLSCGVKIIINYKKISYADHGNKLTTGEGMMYGLLFITFYAIAYSLFIIGSIVVIRDEWRFYLRMLGWIFEPLFVLYVVTG